MSVTASDPDRRRKWVYLFGAGRSDGSADMRELLGGKGANLAEMASLGLPVPPGFTISTEVCAYYYANDRTLPEGLEVASRERARYRRRCSRCGVRRSEEPVARLGPFGRAGLDARHDGHDPQPRPQRRDGGGSGATLRRRALRLRQLSPLHPDVQRRRAGRRASACSRRSSKRTRTRTA